MGETCISHGEVRNAYIISVGKPKGKKPLGRPTRRWKNNINNITEIAWEDVNWIYLTQNRDRWLVLLNMVMNLSVS
jgi:hypothetical protein